MKELTFPLPRSRWFLLLTLLLIGPALLLSACTSREDAKPCDCPTIGGPAKWSGLFEDPVSGPDLSYHQPSYNPTNGQQLVYRRGSRADLDQRVLPALTVGLWVGGATNGQQSPLLRGYDVLFSPNYGPNGWVAFCRGGQVWKAKANGDSLQQLTSGNSGHFVPRWSPDGTRLVCHRDNTAPGGPILIVERTGRPVRSLLIENTKYALAWSPDGNFLLLEYDPTRKDMGLATYNLRTNQLETVVTIPKADNSYGFVYGAVWLPDGQSIVWCCSLGLYQTNLATRRTVRLRSGCLGRQYQNPAVSPDGRQLAVERTDRRVSDDGYSMHTETNIWTLDIDGRNERKVQF